MINLFSHRTRTEVERWRRIKLTVWAYAYEIANDPIATDEQFDVLARQIDVSIPTGRDDLDDWWRQNFQPHTGMWIHNHPEKHLARKIYERFR